MKANSLINFIFLFATFPIFAGTTCVSSVKNTSVQVKSVTKISEVKSSGRVYFYEQPFEQCINKTFVINNDRLISFKRYEGFDYVAYITKDGRTVNGWVKNSYLVDVSSSEGTISPNDYTITIDGVDIYIGQPIDKLKDVVLTKTGKDIELNMIGSNGDASIFGVDFPNSKDLSIYVSDLNHSIRNNEVESVTQISIYSNGYSTSRGVKIGDDLVSVVKKYGSDSIEEMQADGHNTLSYQYLDMDITFAFNAKNKVDSIVYVLLPWPSVLESLQCSHNTSL